jgi:hypothetical protein
MSQHLVCHKVEQASPHNAPQQRIQTQPPSAQHNAAPNNFNAPSNPLDQVIIHIYRNSPTLLPQRGGAMTSSHIDNVTYAVWQICLKQNNGWILNGVAKTSVMLDDVKIRALAMLNLLPSWWIMRDRFVSLLKNNNDWTVDDSEMEINFGLACRTATQVLQIKGNGERRMGHGGAMGQDGGYFRMTQANMNGPAHVKHEDGFAHMSPLNAAIGMGHFDNFAQRTLGYVPVRKSHLEGPTQTSPYNGHVRMVHDEAFSHMSPGTAPARKDNGIGIDQMSPYNGPVHNDHGNVFDQMSPNNGPVRNNHDNGLAHMSPGNIPTRMNHGKDLAQMSPGNVHVHNNLGNDFVQMSPSNGHGRINHTNSLALMNPNHEPLNVGDNHDFAQKSPHDAQAMDAQTGNDGEVFEGERLADNF